jgi:hypothetical protein
MLSGVRDFSTYRIKKQIWQLIEMSKIEMLVFLIRYGM